MRERKGGCEGEGGRERGREKEKDGRKRGREGERGRGKQWKRQKEIKAYYNTYQIHQYKNFILRRYD